MSGATVRGGGYTLAINAVGEHYQAETELRRPMPVGSLRAEYHRNGEPTYSRDGYDIYYYS